MKGVISFTFNLAMQRCYLRVRADLKPEVLCHAVSSVKNLAGRQVVKNENGEEVTVCMCVYWRKLVESCLGKLNLIDVYISASPCEGTRAERNALCGNIGLKCMFSVH